MIETSRLVLRPWKATDLDPCAEMGMDPDVMEFFPATLTFDQTKSMIQKYFKSISEKGWGFWACALKNTDTFIGFIGIDNRFVPDNLKGSTELGWRLKKEHWGKGYATEGAKAVLQFGFQDLGLEEIVAFTAKLNLRSQRVMEKIGMTHDPKDDFEHPKLPPGHPLRPHVLFRIRN